MNFSEIVLLIGIVVLTCGSLALLIVRLTSPNLLGISWLGGAFAAGALSAGLMFVPQPALSIFGSDLTLLLSFMLLHIAVLKLVRDAPVPFWHGGLLLGVMLLVDMFRTLELTGNRPRIVAIGLLVAIQAATTAFVLWRFSRGQVRAPSIFSAVLLAGFAGFNLLRSGVEIFDRQNHQLIACFPPQPSAFSLPWLWG